MSCKVSRRTFLTRHLPAAGLLAGGGLSALAQTRTPREIPDRSADAPSLPVAVARCASYEPKLLRAKVDTILGQIGGIGKLVQGKTVSIKLNLTGGPRMTLGGLPAYRTYHVHPNMVAALAAAVADAGARRIVIIESNYSDRPIEEVLTGGGWDIAAIKSAGSHRVAFEDTRNRGQWPAYSRLKVSGGGLIYPAFDVNSRYEKTDVFISLAKMKDHANAGVTLAVKNVFGMPPTSLYGNDAPNEKTTSFRGNIFHKGHKVPDGVPGEVDHGLEPHWSHRVPRITVDVLGARPIDLSVIDGIESNRGGEGPWIPGTEPIQPHLLLAGRNAVCTDSVCTAVMGYDPMAATGEFPFPGENHLALAARLGEGIHDPKQIEVAGLSIKEAVHPFNPRRLTVGKPIAT